MKLDKKNNVEFANYAHPHSWLLVADNLFQQSVALYQSRGKSGLQHREGNGKLIGEWDDTNRATFLLSGFALENVIKSFLVYEHPDWVSNGSLAKELKSHRLVKLSEKSNILPWPKRGKAILGKFEDGIESWARYPCSLSINGTRPEAVLSDSLWNQYLVLMHRYGVTMMSLLEKGWDGPHGVEGSFVFSNVTYLTVPNKNGLGARSSPQP